MIEKTQSFEKKKISEMYKEIAVEYLKGGKTMHEVCTEYEERIGFFPNRTTAWAYVKRLREKIKEQELKT